MSGRDVCIVLLALACLTGCSVQMAYNNLDRLARWSVSDYVEMTDEQQAYFDHHFRVLWDWHRYQHLPQYADFLDQVAVRVQDPVDSGYLESLVNRVVAWADEIEGRALPVAAEVLASLSDAQVHALAQALEESNLELAEPERDATAAEARQRWREEFIERFSRFSGRLNRVQRGYLEVQSEHYRPELVLWAEYRRRWQADFLALLGHRRDVDGLTRGLRQLAAHRERYFSPELSAVYDHNNGLTRAVSVWLINSLDDRQRERFTVRVEDLAEAFRSLAARPRRDTADAAAPCLAVC